MNANRQFREQICDALGVAHDMPADEIVGLIGSLMPKAMTEGGGCQICGAEYHDGRDCGCEPPPVVGSVCPARIEVGPLGVTIGPHEPSDKSIGIAMLETCRHCAAVYRPAVAALANNPKEDDDWVCECAGCVKARHTLVTKPSRR